MKRVTAAVSFGVAMAVSHAAVAQFGYSLVGQFSLPAGSATWDVGPDGRVWALAGQSVWAQGAPGGGGFSLVGSLPAGTVAPWGGSFIRVNQAGSMIAIGDNGFGSAARVHFVTPGGLASAGPGGATTLSLPLANFDGNWDGNQFYVAGYDSGPFVARVSFTDATGTPVSTRIIEGIGGGNGGVAFHGGRIYTGVGFGGAGLPAGDIRSFDLLSVNSAAAPVAYATGTPISGGPVLTAWPLAFDAAGRLIVGGGDAFGGTTDLGYAAVVDPVTGVRQTLAPGAPNAIYTVDFNAALGSVYVSDGSTVYQYAVPAPGAAGALALGFIGRRRRARRG